MNGLPAPTFALFLLLSHRPFAAARGNAVAINCRQHIRQPPLQRLDAEPGVADVTMVGDIFDRAVLLATRDPVAATVVGDVEYLIRQDPAAKLPCQPVARRKTFPVLHGPQSYRGGSGHAGIAAHVRQRAALA